MADRRNGASSAAIGMTAARLPFVRRRSVPAADAEAASASGRDTDLGELQQVFGSSPRRRAELFQKLEHFVSLARNFALFRSLYIDGSFVTDKEAPGDIDAVLEIPRHDFPKLLAHPNALALVDASSVKSTYEVHLFFQPPPPVPAGADMTEFFQHLRPEEAISRRLNALRRRGILRVLL
jgi:hypothetical protein